MKILAYNPGHDGAIAYLIDGHLKFSIEAEKNSNYRYSPVSSHDVFNILGELDEIPDIIPLVQFCQCYHLKLSRPRLRHLSVPVGPTFHILVGKSMEDIRAFKSRANEDGFEKHRNSFRENFTWLEAYCKEAYGKGDFINWLSKQVDIIKGNEDAIRGLVELDYIKSNSLNFEVSPTVRDATDFLRKLPPIQKLSQKDISDQSNAVLILLKQLRDNITHSGKFETETTQYERNYHLINLASNLSDVVIERLKVQSKANGKPN